MTKGGQDVFLQNLAINGKLNLVGNKPEATDSKKCFGMAETLKARTVERIIWQAHQVKSLKVVLLATCMCRSRNEVSPPMVTLGADLQLDYKQHGIPREENTHKKHGQHGDMGSLGI